MLSLLLFGGLLAFGSGSKILFEANPDIIQSNLTQTLSMRCSLNDTADAFVGGVVGRRDVTQTASNMQVVTSLVITRNNGEHVATIYGAGGAKALADLNTLTVDGDISGGIGERGYIELTWQPPSSAQVGEYVCEINAVDNQGHNVVFSTSAEIGERQPTIGELIEMIRKLETDASMLESKLQLVETKKNKVKNLLSTQCAARRHTEKGSIDFGARSTWQRIQNMGNYPAHANSIYQSFAKPYTTAPKVELGVTALDHDNRNNIRYDVTVTSVNTTGFTAKCVTWADSDIYKLTVSWISLE